MKKAKQRITFLSVILSICNVITMSVDSQCGDWEPYKDEKCFKIFEKLGFQTYENAEKACLQQENSASLVIIRSLQEQEFISKLLFKIHGVVDTIWIGAKRNNTKIVWDDGSNLSFTNWAEGRPTTESGYDCVQMIPDIPSTGKWVDEPCAKRNLIVCQKMQNWSIFRLQKTLLDARKELQDSLVEVQIQLKNQQATIDNHQTTIKNHETTISNQHSMIINQEIIIKNLQQNPVPIGFIYVQLPAQPDPKYLWTAVEWKDVTSEYAGLFFRAEGGGSQSFGVEQGFNSPRLTQVERRQEIPSDQDIGINSMDMILGQWSKFVYTGSYGDNEVHLRFKLSDGEVRPRNKAMRIWKRIK